MGLGSAKTTIKVDLKKPIKQTILSDKYDVLPRKNKSGNLHCCPIKRQQQSLMKPDYEITYICTIYI